MKLEKMMTRDVEKVSPDDSLEVAARKMRDRNIGLLPVVDGRRIVGVISDRDITVRGIAGGMDPRTTPVRDLATSEVIWCYHDEEVEKAAQLMQDYQIRRMVILNRENQTLAGMVSLGDLTSHTKSAKVGEILERVSAHH